MTPILHLLIYSKIPSLRAFLGNALRGKIAHKQRVNLNCHNRATKATEMFQSSDKIKD